jgi:hydroxypyruvate reductase
VPISGGETTVTLRGRGRGGRNAAVLLGLAVALDGTGDNAGALLAPDTRTRAAALGLDARDRLAGDDGYGFLEASGDLVVTGPALTNVDDFRAVLIIA